MKDDIAFIEGEFEDINLYKLFKKNMELPELYFAKRIKDVHDGSNASASPRHELTPAAMALHDGAHPPVDASQHVADALAVAEPEGTGGSAMPALPPN